MNRRYPSLAEDELTEPKLPKPFSWDRAARSFITWSIPPLIVFGAWVEYQDASTESRVISCALMGFLAINWWVVTFMGAGARDNK